MKRPFAESIEIVGIALVFIGTYYGILFAIPNTLPAPVIITFQLMMIGIVTMALACVMTLFKWKEDKE